MSENRGRKPKTEKELKASKSWRAKLPPAAADVPDMERPISGRGSKTPPSWLTEAEVKIWEEFLPKALEMKTYQNADHFSFGLFCRAAQDLLDVQQVIRSEGIVYDAEFFGKDGTAKSVPKKHPLVDIERVRRDSFIKYADQFGFNPLARTRLKINPFTRKPPAGPEPALPPVAENEFHDMMGIEKTE